jgi:tripartite-type tricarboxylate transporter receptor subunit TctC
MTSRALVLGCTALVFMLGASSATAQQTFPDRPVRMIVPVPAGGALDVTARLVAEKMREKLGQPFIVENRPGGDTVLGTRAVKDSPADGYTILVQSNGFSTQPALKLNPGYDPIKDFIPIGPLVRGPIVVEVGGTVPDRTLKEWIARARTSKLSYASPGIGSAPHFAGAMLISKLGLDVMHVPYKGASAAYSDVASGRVDLFFDGYAGSAPYIKSSKFRALAVTAPTRIDTFPDTPTLQELGIDVTYSYWFGLIVKAGTPASVVQRLSEALNYATSSKDLLDRFRADGVDPSFMTPTEFRDYIAREVDVSAKLAAELKLPKE